MQLLTYNPVFGLQVLSCAETLARRGDFRTALFCYTQFLDYMLRAIESLRRIRTQREAGNEHQQQPQQELSRGFGTWSTKRLLALVVKGEFGRAECIFRSAVALDPSLKQVRSLLCA